MTREITPMAVIIAANAEVAVSWPHAQTLPTSVLTPTQLPTGTVNNVLILWKKQWHREVTGQDHGGAGT